MGFGDRKAFHFGIDYFPILAVAAVARGVAVDWAAELDEAGFCGWGFRVTGWKDEDQSVLWAKMVTMLGDGWR